MPDLNDMPALIALRDERIRQQAVHDTVQTIARLLELTPDELTEMLKLDKSLSTGTPVAVEWTKQDTLDYAATAQIQNELANDDTPNPADSKEDPDPWEQPLGDTFPGLKWSSLDIGDLKKYFATDYRNIPRLISNRSGITTIGELMKWTPAEVLGLELISDKRLELLLAALQELAQEILENSH